MNILNYAFKRVLPVPKVLENDSFAFIGAHPDDIECGCGATVACLTGLKKKVSFIIVTDGRYGTMDPSKNYEEVIEIRRKESIAAAKVLGVTDVRFLEYPDGGGYDLEKVADTLAVHLVDIKPDIVFVIDNHVKSEIHPDHLKVGRASELAYFKCSFPLMMQELGLSTTANPIGLSYYFTDCPNTFINVSKTFNKKILSIKEHGSQFLSGDKGIASIDKLISYYKFTATRDGLKRFCRYGEGFRVLSTVHLHCTPEASRF